MYVATVANDKLNLKIYLFDLTDSIKILPIFFSFNEEQQLFIELVDDCSKIAEQNYTVNSFSTITVDIKNTRFVNNIQNSYLKLFNENEVIACKRISLATYLSANGMNVYVEQNNAFVAPRVTKDFKNLAIGETCNKTSDKVIIHNGYAPKLILFGGESKIFKVRNFFLYNLLKNCLIKALSIDGNCSILLPKYGFSILTASILHPVIGKIHLIQTSKDYFVITDLQSIFDVNETSATLHFSREPTISSSCFNFSSSYKVKDSIPIRGFSTKNCLYCILLSLTMPNLSFLANNNIQSFSRFIEFDSIKSLQVDLGWIKVILLFFSFLFFSHYFIVLSFILSKENGRNIFQACANLTLLASGVIKGNAILRTHNIAASRHLADIEIFEYPLFNETEIIASGNGDSKNNVKNLYFYKRPIDMTVSTAPPCSESTIGAKIKLNWEKELIKKLELNKPERLFLNDKILTGSKSVVGLTIMADFDENAVACGSVELYGQKKIAMALFNDTGINGFVKIVRKKTNTKNYNCINSLDAIRIIFVVTLRSQLLP